MFYCILLPWTCNILCYHGKTSCNLPCNHDTAMYFDTCRYYKIPTLLPWKCYDLVPVCRVFQYNTTGLQTYPCRLPLSRQSHQCQAENLRYSKCYLPCYYGNAMFWYQSAEYSNTTQLVYKLIYVIFRYLVNIISIWLRI